ncbi:helix-turn-helix transcriptional regulator [Salmonella enterica]|uniref:helix-turn-helix transcriptional regulator n=1 Tax=Serratia symbiotica TaxID=138074 RepID=UPI000F97DE79|nr:helix-turn-helix transcriptional regulator [Serratia symbiotica]EAA9523879.1 XRE family transcriptional regulator [Salmonella enterica]EDX2043316.1 helix-turn-helix transcriptional regulator [Salmonella enterica subsp. houtenae serovar 50:z4,z23:-]HCZ1709001.1 helix-turn-helix transcriptional regulator [Salmonella enterica subsp. enterica serovar Montevideo str. 0269]EAB1817012.1 XRE family transcriptional regulator [Salmonella enterica]EAM8825113.1 XRE family transcriptional regulator [Sal
MADNNEFSRIFCMKINEIRVLKGLTIEQLAELASVHRTTIGLIIRYERFPSLSMAKKIADALDVKLSLIIESVEFEISKGDAE